MENKPQGKYFQVSCYFCSEWLENENFKDHIRHCGQVLEKCPNLCTSYVQRKFLEVHLKECPKSGKTVNNMGANTQSQFKDIENRIIVIEQDIGAFRSALNEEIRQRLHLITDVGSLKKRNQVSDEWTNKVGDVLTALKKCINEETESRCIDIRKCKEDIERLLMHYQQLDDWKIEMCMRIDEIQSEIIQDDNYRAHIDTLMSNGSISIQKLDYLDRELNSIKSQLEDNRKEMDRVNRLNTEKFFAIDLILEDQHNSLTSTTNGITKKISKLEAELETKSISNSEINAKQSKLDYEIKSMKHVVFETEDKCEKFDKIISSTKAIANQTRQDMADLEIHLAYQNKIMSVQNTRGHLIWRISEYSVKLKDAKEHDTTIRSPIFCNRQYGYTLRLDVNLNGIGTWKGRNIIACLTIVAGEYDSLLPWPCKIEADIILRDQPDDITKAKNLTKTIIAKRKSDNFETNQYIHIPHKTLETCNFVKNDVIFFEVRVLKSNY